MTNQIVYDVCKVIRADAGCPKGMRKTKSGGCAPAKAKQGGGGWGKAALGAAAIGAVGLGAAAYGSTRHGQRTIGHVQTGIGRATKATGNFLSRNAAAGRQKPTAGPVTRSGQKPAPVTQKSFGQRVGNTIANIGGSIEGSGRKRTFANRNNNRY